MKAKEMGRKTIKGVNNIVNLVVLTVIILLLAFAGYALWDSNQLYNAADKSHYAVYKPTAKDEGKSFKELQALNTEVIAWLSVYGTNIDYPVTQGGDNMKYVNTNVEGQYSLSGAIFLDCDNNSDFSDFKNILYGHHMDKKVMFGEIGEFSDKKMFDDHRYGNLYFDGKDHGIEFFAFIHTDAYDSCIFTLNTKNENRQEYLDELLAKAVYQRDVGVAVGDHIVLLSTCSSGSTNGRDILAGKITDELYDDPFVKTQTNGVRELFSVDGKRSFLEKVPQWLLWLTVILAVLILAAFIFVYHHKRKQSKSKPKRERDI